MHSSYNYSDFIDLLPGRSNTRQEPADAEPGALRTAPVTATMKAATGQAPTHGKGKYTKG